MCFCFFKQKTAYEMRISDWSSDVCSSDLPRPEAARLPPDRAARSRRQWLPCVADSGRVTAPAPRAIGRCPAAGRRSWPSDCCRGRSEERRVGKECVSTFRSGGSQYHEKKKRTKQPSATL